ncbi:MAG: hypothetical protein ACLGIS_11630 [Actinomycetes bacterium]
MPWFKVDDGFHGHPKVVELSLEAVGVWTLAGSWCAAYLTDGEIGLKSIQRLGGGKEQADELVYAGLWLEPLPGVYQFKDWDDYQPLKETVEAEREAARERMQKVRAKKKGTEAEASADVQANSDRTSEEVRVTPTHPIPSRPITTTPTADAAAEFDQWYAAYPRKIDKGHARTAFKTARKKTSFEVLMAAVQQFALHSKGTEPKFLAYPATWLNGERWEDEAPRQTVVNGPWSPEFHQRNGSRG